LLRKNYKNSISDLPFVHFVLIQNEPKNQEAVNPFYALDSLLRLKITAKYIVLLLFEFLP